MKSQSLRIAFAVAAAGIFGLGPAFVFAEVPAADRSEIDAYLESRAPAPIASRPDPRALATSCIAEEMHIPGETILLGPGTSAADGNGIAAIMQDIAGTEIFLAAPKPSIFLAETYAWRGADVVEEDVYSDEANNHFLIANEEIFTGVRPSPLPSQAIEGIEPAQRGTHLLTDADYRFLAAARCLAPFTAG